MTKQELKDLLRTYFRNNGTSPYGTGVGNRLQPSDLIPFFDAMIDFSSTNLVGVNKVTFDGDSLTAKNSGDTILPYPEIIRQSLIEPDWTGFANYGVGGQRAGQMLSDAVSQIDGQYDSSVVKHQLVVWGGINDIYQGYSVDSLKNNLTSYVQGRAAKGFKVLMCTLTSGRGKSYPEKHEAMEVARIEINTWIRANWKTLGASALIDLASDARIGNYDSGLNTVYFTDGIHMTNAGRTIVANMVKEGLIAVRNGVTPVITGEGTTTDPTAPAPPAGGTPIEGAAKAVAPEAGYFQIEDNDINWTVLGTWQRSSGPLPTWYIGDERGSTTGTIGGYKKMIVQARYIDLLNPYIKGAGNLEMKVTRTSDGLVVGTQTWNHNAINADRRSGYPDGNTPQITIDTGVFDTYEIKFTNLGGGSNNASAIDTIRIRR